VQGRILNSAFTVIAFILDPLPFTPIKAIPFESFLKVEKGENQVIKSKNLLFWGF
jgi:hypothetical protein